MTAESEEGVSQTLKAAPAGNEVRRAPSLVRQPQHPSAGLAAGTDAREPSSFEGGVIMELRGERAGAGGKVGTGFK